ncbi:salutaridine reductase-like [Pistacia vera]|uniref:salutaridine reductase-like n=1 Tax=Pistacia vera TaxID=55513 RepID=UPI001263DACE|nr:salutaridine reductase-like [Pistacia vera]
MVILTARDKKRGHEAVQSLHDSGFSDVAFHQLDLMDLISIDSFASFIRTQFQRLDILVNNAGISGAIFDAEAFISLNLKSGEILGENAHLVKQIMKQTYETAEGCLRTNYYGTKQVTEALIPLLLQSDSARIVNVSSALGQLKFLSHERANRVLPYVKVLLRHGARSRCRKQWYTKLGGAPADFSTISFLRGVGA